MTKYDIVSKFLAYRHKTDVTNLPPGVLTVGSQNVVLNDGERVAVRQGYTLDGQASTAMTPIKSAFDWETHLATELHVRSFYDKLQFRYIDPDTNDPVWTDVMTGFGDAVNFNYVDFWDADEQTDVLLFVNGSSNIYEWSGGVTTFLSATSSTITKEGTGSWAESGFLTIGTRKVKLDGIEFTYTGGESTTTLTGVTPDPSNATIDQEQTTQNGQTSFGQADATTKHVYVAQSFVPTDATLIGLNLNKQADNGTFTGTVTIDIEADSAGSPSGVSLGSVTITNADWLLMPVGLFSVTFSTPITLTPASTYWIKLAASTADTSNHPNIGRNSAGGYASGSVKYFDTADGWTAIATIDLTFGTITATAPPTVGSLIIQVVRTYANSTTTGLPSTFANDLIGILYNQIYIGSLVSREVFVSQVDSFLDYSFSSPRLIGEGALLTLDASAVGFIPQEDAMYITAGPNMWFATQFQTALSSTTAVETLSVVRLKTTGQAASQSQSLIAKIKNYVFFVSNEPSLDTLGKIELIDTPQSTNISDPIKLDFDNYDFTDGCCYYWKNYIFVAMPMEGKVLMFSMARALLASQSATAVSINSDGALVGWEAPQILPLSRFSTINGELYGHSSQVPETYKLFNGYSDNGNPIDARAIFSYQNGGDRANQKNFNEFYSEGYISSNTTLYLTISYNYGGCEGTTDVSISGSDPMAVCASPDTDGSLGKQNLGIRSLAGRGVTEDTALPPKFRLIKTFPKTDCFEWQTEYSTNDVDQRWELLAFGPNAMISTSSNAQITE